MTSVISCRVARGIGGIAVGAAAITCVALLFVRAPVVLVMAGTFIAPLIAAALAFATRSLYLAARGRPRRTRPPVRPGRMEARPLSPMARRRPRT